MRNVIFRPTGRVVGVLLLALVVLSAGCGGDDDDDDATASDGGGRIDQQLVFGGPPECLERPLCLGDTEAELYGLDFKEVKKLDPGGPVTVTALEDGTIDVGLLFTGSSVIKDNFVLLEDDKGLQPSDNPTAIINSTKVDDNITSIIDAVNEKLTLDEYNTMALAVFNDLEDPSDVAGAFLERNGLLEGGDSGAGTSLKVGSKDFAGAQLLSQAYGQALAANGYDISYQDNIGPTETVVPLLRDGTIDLYGEYTGTFLTFLAGTPTSDADETYAALTEVLTDEGLTATTPAAAQDVNGFYVTQETADEFNVSTISDLTKEG
jgi:osmoprotectant transport system substrate-binding protein